MFYLQILIALQYVKWILYHCLQGAYKQMGQKKKLHTQVKNEKNDAKMPHKDKQCTYTCIWTNNCILMIHICYVDLWQLTDFIFVFFLFLIEYMFLPLKVYLVYFAYFLKITTHFIISWVHFPDPFPSCSLQGHYQVLKTAGKQILYSYLIFTTDD